MLNSIITGELTLQILLICMGAEAALGLLAALLYKLTSRSASASFTATLALLPLVAGTIILVVNGNLGAGIAVAGSFSLVRFRSVQGSAREILAVFVSMALGLCVGAGYVAVAVALLVVYALLTLLVQAIHLGGDGQQLRQLKITIPETLDYEALFDDVLNRYTRHWSLESVHTAEMGSVYQLVYTVALPDIGKSRTLLDEIRTRNGNLNVALQRIPEKGTM